MEATDPFVYKHVRDEHAPHVRRNKNSASFRATTSSETEPPRSSAQPAGEAVRMYVVEPDYWCLRCAYFKIDDMGRIKIPVKYILSSA